MATVEWTYNLNGIDRTHTLPATFAVCWNCEGHGTHLTESIREHAYTREEFDETFFEDEERAEYFKRGGIYDVQCSTCKGARVVLEVDESQLSKRMLALYTTVTEREARLQAGYRAEERMERMMGC